MVVPRVMEAGPGPDVRSRPAQLARRRPAWVYEQAAVKAAYRLLPHEIQPCAGAPRIATEILVRADQLRRQGALVVLPDAPLADLDA